jgi:hypothetical protein
MGHRKGELLPNFCLARPRYLTFRGEYARIARPAEAWRPAVLATTSGASKVERISPAPLLSCSITPRALFGRCLAISAGRAFVPVSTLGLSHLANNERSGGKLLAITLAPSLALVLQSFPVRCGHTHLFPRGNGFYTSAGFKTRGPERVPGPLVSRGQAQGSQAMESPTLAPPRPSRSGRTGEGHRAPKA